MCNKPNPWNFLKLLISIYMSLSVTHQYVQEGTDFHMDCAYCHFKAVLWVSLWNCIYPKQRWLFQQSPMAELASERVKYHIVF